ncbi:ATP-binding cassette domain-containing protein, partial [Peptococcus simiae]|uniref:ATP-binding cassette domain-containing protein n=1 Tax=Peptococcus simiae TaxID=1643805 RepID=UPI00397F3B0C
LENKGIARQQIQDRLEEMLALFPIHHLLDRDIFCLSGGEKQVLSLAAAYISGTPIIVLDEPSSNLDDRYTGVLANMLQTLKARGVTLIIAEHRLHYLMPVVDRVCLIEDGRLVETYSAEAFIDLSEDDRQARGLRSPVDTPLKRLEPPQLTGDLTVKKLQRQFKGTGTGFAIQGLGLDRGCVYGIIGHNGAGKSTFLRALLGLEGGRGDTVYFKGKRVSKRQRLALASLVMQDVNHQLFTETVDKEVSLGLKNIDRVAQGRILDQLGLGRLADRHPMSLSGGEKQRVAIASALLSDRPIIAFDEPTSGMDWHHMVDLSRLIKALAQQGKIVLVISHDKEFLNRTADRLINMEDYAMPYKR